jgi:Glycosyltransferase 61
VQPLSAREFENAVVYPTIRVASHPGRLLMGVYHRDQTFIDGTALDRRAGEVGAPVPPDLFPLVSDSAAPEAIYAGPLYFHFGHFLLESLARVWYARRNPAAVLLWAGSHLWQDRDLTPWQREILQVLGIENPTAIVASPTRVQHLHVPDVGYRYDDWFHPQHAHFLARYAGPAQVPGRKLWLSRGKITSNVRDLNAEATESRLADAGWQITYPELLGIREQLDNLASAEIVAGEEGSAFHALMLLGEVGSKRLHVFRRHGDEHRNMHTIGRVRGIEQSFHSLDADRVIRATGRVVSKISPNSSQILDVLNVPVPHAADMASATVSDPAVQDTLSDLAAERFLEVGASGAAPVLSSTAAIRVAVSRRFDFDPRSYASSGVAFYELDLAQYADVFHVGHRRFDVIQISGTEFEEAMASFGVSLRLAHRHTVWVLGRGGVAERVALAIRALRPGFAVTARHVRRTPIYIARTVHGEPADESEVAALPPAEVRRRLRWLWPDQTSVTGSLYRGIETALGPGRAAWLRELERGTRRRLSDRIAPPPTTWLQRARAARARASIAPMAAPGLPPADTPAVGRPRGALR